MDNIELLKKNTLKLLNSKSINGKQWRISDSVLPRYTSTIPAYQTIDQKAAEDLIHEDTCNKLNKLHVLRQWEETWEYCSYVSLAGEPGGAYISEPDDGSDFGCYLTQSEADALIDLAISQEDNQPAIEQETVDWFNRHKWFKRDDWQCIYYQEKPYYSYDWDAISLCQSTADKIIHDATVAKLNQHCGGSKTAWEYRNGYYESFDLDVNVTIRKLSQAEADHLITKDQPDDLQEEREKGWKKTVDKLNHYTINNHTDWDYYDTFDGIRYRVKSSSKYWLTQSNADAIIADARHKRTVEKLNGLACQEYDNWRYDSYLNGYVYHDGGFIKQSEADRLIAEKEAEGKIEDIEFMDNIKKLHNAAPIYENYNHLLLQHKELQTALDKAVNTLKSAGYTDCGGELWKPPLGKHPGPLLKTIDQLRKKDMRQLMVLQDIREVVEDVPGTLMQDELVEKIRNMKYVNKKLKSLISSFTYNTDYFLKKDK